MLTPITQYAVIHREDFDLMVNSEYGETWGQGSYPAYGYANFGLDNSFIHLSRDKRMKFTGWTTTSDDGYIGNTTEGTVLCGISAAGAGLRVAQVMMDRPFW